MGRTKLSGSLRQACISCCRDRRSAFSTRKPCLEPIGVGLRHQALIAYLMMMRMAAGLFAYFSPGRAEDPDFTIKAMIFSATWRGATAREMELQVTVRF